MQIVHTYPEIRFNPLGPEQGSKAELQTQSPHVQQITFPVITCGTVVVFRQTDASLQIQIEPPVQFPCDVRLQNFIVQFKDEKKKSLEAKMLQSLSILMHKKNFIQRVDVDINATGDDIDIVLYSKSDKIIDKSSLSMGERQMYASALLSSLVDESEIEFPVFIDSPMQKFDEQHAENIIRYFYPNVSKQVVIFPLINKELTEKEYSILLPKICRAYLIDNISTDSSEFVEAPSDKFIEKYNQKYNAD